MWNLVKVDIKDTLLTLGSGVYSLLTCNKSSGPGRNNMLKVRNKNTRLIR